jgi:hypothetical protein
LIVYFFKGETMQAIKTKFLSCTDTKGARIVASCAGGKIRHVMGYRHELSRDANHCEAAKLLRDKLNWANRMVYGQFGDEYFFVPTVEHGSDRSF